LSCDVNIFLILSGWELEFIDGCESLAVEYKANKGTSLHYMTSRSMDDELSRATSADSFTMVLSYLIMSTFTAICISRNYNAVESRVGLSLCGITCIILGMINDDYFHSCMYFDDIFIYLMDSLFYICCVT
jgi:hypothetical protein